MMYSNKKSILMLAVVMSLAACKSSSKNDDEIDTPDVPESAVKDLSIKLIPDTARLIASSGAVTENNYEHFVEEDNYKIKVNGEIVKSDITLNFEDPIEVSVQVPNEDNVLIEVLHPNLSADREANAVYTSTFDGEQEVNKSQDFVDIVLDNTHYGFITLDVNPNVYINQAMLNGELLKRSDETSYSDFVYKYAYTSKVESLLAVETELGIQAVNFQTGSAKQFKFELNEDDHSLILDDEGDLIEDGVIAINPNRIKNAESLQVLVDGTVIGNTLGHKDKVSSIIYSMRDFSGEVRKELPISRYDLELTVEIDDPSAHGFTNIYMRTVDNKNCSSSFYVAGALQGQVDTNCGGVDQSFDSYEAFIKEHGSLLVRNNYGEWFGFTYISRVNFVTRIGGTAYDDVTEFTVKEYLINQSAQAISLNNVVRADDVKVNDDGSVSGITTGKNPWAFASVSGDELLSDYSLNIDIEFEGASHFMNIYLINTDSEQNEQVTADYILSGSKKGMLSFQGENEWMELNDFMERYGHYGVRTFINRDGLKWYSGNFFWRGGGSDYSGAGDEFIIHQFSVK